jgi:hypothetical protein
MNCIELWRRRLATLKTNLFRRRLLGFLELTSQSRRQNQTHYPIFSFYPYSGLGYQGGAEARIRTKLLKDGHIDTVIGLPAKLFFSTGIPVCILVLKKCN